jgi:DNA-binding NarL/FixJ family response regulator
MDDIAVVIADNQPISISGIRSAVADENDIRILAECQSSDHLLNAVRQLCPDVVLVSEEILRKENQKLGALEKLVSGFDEAQVEETRVIVITSEKAPEFLETALRSGAKGVFQREWPIQQIPMAIRKVTNGGVWLEQGAAERVLEQTLMRRKTPNSDETRIASLTPREREVIGLICEGLRNKEITARLHISLATVSHHLTSIYRKLEVSDRTSLVIYAAKQRLVTF